MLEVSGRVLFYRDAVDMRKSIDGLAVIVAESANQPGDGSIYVFCNKSRDKVKLLYWDRNGFCLWYKRLEKQRFKIPQICGDNIQLKPEEFRWLMDGLDISKMKGFKRLEYSRYC